ncbi:hypothetical protein N7462_003312 [Penicillium macrosclerotiorum]|uniref:uncharacterized protein n=1 Tax=Penicillium macrosclerotiorum TaxID=303699 RepID=UPI00254902C2|nr:uncharacterized protein N7462_003312 [Penicillium macrosclerotiorum]KAJ5688920.1 hypothetical protein N7462_003312 [Penicillium macrosclerotiorum]
MSPPTQTSKPAVPIALSADAIDDLIYDSRAGDLEALTTDITSLAAQHSCSEDRIVASAIDMEDESEGGTGSCVLHFPAANGNSEILNFLLQKLSTADAALRTAFVNHRNHSGNTPLHWAALNTHLECVKALVEAGADVTIKNDAGHDAVFLAERAAWSASAEEVDENEDETQEIEMTVGEPEGQGEGEQQPAGEMSAGRQVVEWLLSSEKAAALESSATEGEGSA